MEKEYEALLDKFYRGETDRDEELILAGYLNREQVPEPFEHDRRLFQLLETAIPEMPEGLEQRMGALIDSLEHAEQGENPRLSVNRPQNESVPVKRVVTRRYFALQIAGLVASLLLIATIGYRVYFGKSDSEPLLADTFENPEEAQQATLEALQLFADNFSKGTRSVEQVDRQVGETFGILREALGQEVVRTEEQESQTTK